MKNQRGITLVALVITIIVMLILVGVTMAAALSPGGLFTRASDAARNWDEAQTWENDELPNIVDTYVNTYAP